MRALFLGFKLGAASSIHVLYYWVIFHVSDCLMVSFFVAWDHMPGDPAVSSGASNGNHGALNHNKDVSRKSQGCQAREVILEDKCVGGGPGSGLQDDYDKSIKAPLEKRPVAPEPPVNWQGRCYISRARSDPVLRPDVGTPPGGKRKPRPLPDVDMDPHAEPYLRQVWENRQKSAALAATSVTDGSWAAAALFRSGPARSPLPPLIGSER
eukprot:TRINITY_DN2906_c0_g2_i8.p1 TRINITY_DN2906_c0_g2~~TRINITY_DN2906_c0_g2_i8.p1  ORF type:complete len:210 (-),score=23.49 TRINITY_DN2906_c0_g2_i8:195-824(-)